MSQFIEIILYLGAIQGILLSIFLFSIKANKISNRILGFLTLFWGIIILAFALQSDGVFYKYPHLLKISPSLLFLLFPLLFLQVKYLISNQKKFKSSDLWHFAPFILFVILNFNFYFKSGEEKLFLVRNPTSYYKYLIFIQEEIIAIQGIVYSILALRMLTKYKQKIKDYQSNIDKLILKFQYIGISLSLFAWIIGIIGVHLYYLQIDVNVDLFILVYLILVLIIYVISYSALKSPEIYKLDESQIELVLFNNKHQVSTGNGKPSSNEIPIEISNTEDQLSDDPMTDEINSILLEFIDTEKPYLNPELSLQELSDKLGVKRHVLSRLINQKHNKNFYEFINEYRIEEVKVMMINPKNKHYKLMSLAYDAGFNSKATFNRIFKQMTNMTPSQYIETTEAA